MDRWIELLVTVVCAVLASSGFWAFIQTKRGKKDASRKMLLGLGHSRIISMAMEYINRGYISHEEYNDLQKYLVQPYYEMGGDGTVRRLMQEVDKLPIRDSED